MEFTRLSIEGAFVATPAIHADSRGHFFEWFKAPLFAEAVGHDLSLAQANCSVSARGTLRGLHFADVPPGQAKYVTCLAGNVLDVIVDLRVGSPTFGTWESVELSSSQPRMVYLAEGLGHGFVARADASTVVYLCSTAYNPAAEHEVDPFDPDLGIDWGITRDEADLSAKDAAAPSVKAALAAGLLPEFASCQSLFG